MIQAGYLLYGIGYGVTWVVFYSEDPFGCAAAGMNRKRTALVYACSATVWPLLAIGLTFETLARILGERQ